MTSRRNFINLTVGAVVAAASTKLPAAPGQAFERAVIGYYQEQRAQLFKLHPHWVLAAVGTFGLLHRLHPEMFPSQVAWTDIFSDFRLHDTGAVEAAG